MKLIAILLIMATEDAWKSFRAFRPYESLIDYARWLQVRRAESGWFNGPLGVLLAIGPGVIAVALIQVTLHSSFGFIAWFVSLLFAIAVLVASIGRRRADEEVEDYLRALEAGEADTAYAHVSELLQGQDPGTAAARHRLVIEMMLLRNHERLLAILFWFVILGPVGAVLYRSTTQLKGLLYTGEVVPAGFMEAALRLQALLDWIPVRITALCHALVGSFADALYRWRTAAAGAEDMYGGNRAVLVDSGIGSLRLHDDVAVEAAYTEAFRQTVDDTRALIFRTIVVWITVFAVLTIVGWLG